MTWNPNLDDVDQPKEAGGLLKKAVKLSKEKAQYELKDEHGIFAIVTDKSVICAKAYIYGNIVSCHYRIVVAAGNTNKPIKMWIESAKKFYQFKAEDIRKDYTENYKGDARMWNFSIQLGRWV